MAKMNVFDVRVVKLEKNEVYVEYKTCRWGEWIMHSKKFKSTTKANEWIAININIVKAFA